MGRSSLAAIALLLGTVLAHAGPLHEAAGSGDVEKVQQLLAEGEDIGEVEALGTPLHWAAMKGRLAVAEVLVAEGAKVDEPAGVLRFTPLHRTTSMIHRPSMRAKPVTSTSWTC